MDSQTIATGTQGKQVRLFSTESGACIRDLSQGYLSGLAFSADGIHFAAGYQMTIKVWEYRSGAIKHLLLGHTMDVTDVSFSATGRLVASSSCDKTVRIWDMTTGKCLRVLTGHTDQVWSVAFAPAKITDAVHREQADGRSCATVSGGSSSSTAVSGTGGSSSAELLPTPAPLAAAVIEPDVSQFKVIVVGEAAVGKTSIIRQCCDGYFSGTYKSTVGVDFAIKMVAVDDHNDVRLQLWDVAGQERFGAMTRSYFKGAKASFIVCDVSNANALETAFMWKRDIDAKVRTPNGECIATVLLGNKCDLSRAVSDQDIEQFCIDNGILAWFYTSAKENTTRAP